MDVRPGPRKEEINVAWYFFLFSTLIKIFGPVLNNFSERNFQTCKCRIRRNRELYDFFSVPYVIDVIKSLIIRWLGHMKLREKGKLLNKMYGGNIGVRSGRKPKKS